MIKIFMKVIVVLVSLVTIGLLFTVNNNIPSGERPFKTPQFGSKMIMSKQVNSDNMLFSKKDFEEKAKGSEVYYALEGTGQSVQSIIYYDPASNLSYTQEIPGNLYAFVFKEKLYVRAGNYGMLTNGLGFGTLFLALLIGFGGFEAVNRLDLFLRGKSKLSAKYN